MTIAEADARRPSLGASFTATPTDRSVQKAPLWVVVTVFSKDRPLQLDATFASHVLDSGGRLMRPQT